MHFECVVLLGGDLGFEIDGQWWMFWFYSAICKRWAKRQFRVLDSGGAGSGNIKLTSSAHHRQHVDDRRNQYLDGGRLGGLEHQAGREFNDVKT